MFLLTEEMGRAFTRILLASKAAELLGFLETPQDHLILTDLGRQFIMAPRKTRRQLFRGQLLQLPLVKRLKEMLEHSPEREVEPDVLLEELAMQCPQEEPRRLLRILMNWGRFADLWVYQPATSTVATNGAASTPPIESSSAAPPDPS